MSIPFSGCIRAAPFVLLIASGSGVCVSAGCAVPRHSVDAEGAIARSLESSATVVFHEEGSPVAAATDLEGGLTAADAVRRAIESSPELQAALARVRVAQAESDLAALLPNPVLSFVVRFPAGGGSQRVEEAGLAADLLALLQRPRRAAAAGHRLEAEAARALSTALDVVADVQARYSEVQALEELLPVLDRRLELLGRSREVAEARLDLGEGTRHDVTALDSERTELAVEVAQRRQELRVARLALARATGEPSGAATWELEPWSSPVSLPATEEPWIENALEGRPEVLAIEWELRAREEEEKLARRQPLAGATAGVAEEVDGGRSIGPSLATPLPVFDRGHARVERARSLTFEERHRLVQAQRSVIEEVRSALTVVIAAQENHERVVRELIPLQEQRRAEIEEAYRQGFVDVTALLFADQALQQAQARRVGLARDVSLAQNRLQRAVGGPSLFRAAATVDEESQP